MRNVIGYLCNFAALTAFSFTVNSHAAPSEKTQATLTTDTRVLIDVSGSMKSNDPKNLRVPALKLLIDLIPPDSSTGVWIFDEKSTPLLPVQPSQQLNKIKARTAAEKIHSKGQFTNIEEAIIKATSDWKPDNISVKRNLIILTDGKVDIAAGQAASKQSRQNILQTLLPSLQKNKAQVYTISLSDKADLEMLKKMALGTEGWHETVENADNLQRTFAKIFTRAVPRDSVPIKQNRFLIDKSITEFSTLVFHQTDAKPISLTAPDGTEYSQTTGQSDIKWHHEPGYDMITVSAPLEGEWQLKTDADPDNGVFIVTDLSLKFNELPSYAIENQNMEVSALLANDDTPILRQDFLNLLQATLSQEDQIGRKLDWKLKALPDEEKTFTQVINQSLSPGQHTLKLIVDGKSFERIASHTLEVLAEPILVTKEYLPASEDQSARVMVYMKPDQNVLDLRTVEINASIIDDQDQQITQPIPVREGTWILELEAPSEGSRVVINFTAHGKTLRGELVEPVIKPLVLDSNAVNQLRTQALKDKTQKNLDAIAGSASSKEAEAPPDAEENHPEKVEEKENQETPPETDNTDQEEDSEGSGWITTAAIVGINLLLLVGGFFGFKWYKKRSAEKQAALVEKLDS